MTHIFKIALGAICFFTFLPNVEAAVLLTTFGDTTAPTFAVDGSTNLGYTQNSASLQINGLDNGPILAGFFGAPANITGQSSTLTLSGSATSAPASLFSVLLFDANSNSATYQANSWAPLTGGSVTLNYLSSDAGFDFSTISGLELHTGGTGSTINATLTGLTAGVVAAPEPSRVLLGFFGLSLLALRRRR